MCQSEPFLECNSLDQAIDQSYMLSDLYKPPSKSSTSDQHARKKRKLRSISPIVFVSFTIQRNKSNKHRKQKQRVLKALIDSGASSSLIVEKHTKGMPRKSEKEDKVWNTAAGEMKSKTKTKSMEFSLPELHTTRKIQKSFHVVEMELANYDMIIGRDLMTAIGLDVRGSDQSIQWDDAILPWRDVDVTHNEVYLATPHDADVKRLTAILDAKYEKADLRKVVANATHLSKDEQQELHELLSKYKDLFDGTLGKFTGKPYDIKLKPNVTPQHVRSFPVPKLHELTLKTELDRLVKIGVLKKVNRSEWGAPTFVIPKKDGSVRFISDFRLLNKCIQRQPYPIPKIQHLLQNLEGFKYGTALDLNMGYYHLELSAKSKELCTITTQWGKYEYQRLPMGLCNSPDIFQEKMNEILDGLESVRVYIDDVLHVTKGSFKEHLEGLSEILDRLRHAGLKVNANKSSFAAPEMEYLGYMIHDQQRRHSPSTEKDSRYSRNKNAQDSKRAQAFHWNDQLL